jgi:hypothetical protein
MKNRFNLLYLLVAFLAACTPTPSAMNVKQVVHPRISPEDFSGCIFDAAKTFDVPPSVVLGLLHAEGGRSGQVTRNRNGTTRLGPLQINSVWVPKIAHYWNVSEKEAASMIKDDACVNVGVGSWILRGEMNETGSVQGGISRFHSATPDHKGTHRDRGYLTKVIGAMKKYKLLEKS